MKNERTLWPFGKELLLGIERADPHVSARTKEVTANRLNVGGGGEVGRATSSLSFNIVFGVLWGVSSLSNFVPPIICCSCSVLLL